MALRFLVIFFTSCLQLSGCLVLYIQGNETSFDFHLGVTSEIEFYVHGENSDRKELCILVSHKPKEGNTFNTKCVLTQSAKGCNTTSDICICPGDSSSRRVFSLKKRFLQTDSGVWRFQTFSHQNASKTVMVNVVAIMVPVQNDISSQGHESTQASQMTPSTSSNKRNTRSTDTIIVSVVTALVISIAITTVVVVWCRFKILAKITQRILRGETRRSNPLTDIRSEELNEYTTPAEMQQGLCEVDNPRSPSSRVRQSADQTAASNVHFSEHSEMLRGSLMKITTIDFTKSNGTTHTHLVTMAAPALAPAPAPSPPPELNL